MGIVAGEAICGSEPTTTTKRPTTTTKKPTTTTSGQNECFDYNTDIGGAILNGENQDHFSTAELCQANFFLSFQNKAVISEVGAQKAKKVEL